MAASEQKIYCVDWLLKNVERLDYLKSSRNIAGHTPLEELEAQLEALRTTTPHFQGFCPYAVICLAALRDEYDINIVECQRMKFGCTCGKSVSLLFSWVL